MRLHAATAAIACAASMVYGCTDGDSSASDDASPALTDVSYRPESKALKSVASSEETQASLGVYGYDLHEQADGVLRVVANGAHGESLGVFDVRALKDDGSDAEQPEQTAEIEVSSVLPTKAKLRTRLADDYVIENTFARGSDAEELARALQRDLSAAGDASAPGASSSDPSVKPKAVSGPGCYSETSCKVVVMMCNDKCCNGWTYDGNGLPVGTDCTTIDKYACGACAGWGKNSIGTKIGGWFN